MSETNHNTHNRLFYDAVIGKENKDLIPEGSDNVEAFIISNSFGVPIRVFDLQLRFYDGLHDCLISIMKTGKEPLLDGQIQFSQIGNKSSADVIRDCLPVNFIIEPKVDIWVFVSTKPGKQIPPGGVNVTLFGRKE